MVVLIGGRAGTGKTTVANMLVKMCSQEGILAEIIPFARGVKSTSRVMGWDGNKNEKGRRLLQEVGRIGREYDKNLWANMALQRIYELEHDEGPNGWMAIIDDWRFINEGNLLSSKFITSKVRVTRPSEFHALINTDLYNDISEISLPEWNEQEGYYNYVIHNNHGLNDLYCNTETVFLDLLGLGREKII